MTVKTRFAPSPTGYLHVGGARTALYSWLFAKNQGGEFVLRIEDTDLERNSQEAVDAILEGMQWMGMEWDEGPYYQSKRFDRYNEMVDKLLAEDKAYEAAKEGDACVIRFRNPKEGSVVFDDQIRGRIEISNSQLDDLIIRRTDGAPTYNFVVVVDDWDMGITHVVRGEDHINNTPRQINIYEALGAPVPTFAHCAMILGDDGAKLSKRHGAVSVMQYRDEGYLPNALNNYLVRLGWSHGDQEIFSQEEMIEFFSLKAISKSASAFNTEKLLWLNNHYIKTSEPEYVAKYLQWHLDAQKIDTTNGPAITEVIKLVGERCNTLIELAEQSRYFYEDFSEFEAGAAKKHLRGVAKGPLELALAKVEALEDFTTANIKDGVIAAVCEELEIGMGKIGMPLRVAVTGGGQSPSVDAVMELVGKERVIARIKMALEFIAEREANA
ncbi:UNVERIFIED_CONTAM: hypothetical protein GTU68_003950 [Idotea baltica]|nr:hypothetical protein [Idotea baltica]